MSARCAHCPAAEGTPCRAGGFCAWAAGGDPVHLRHIADVALRDAGRPAPPQAAVPCRDSATTPTPTLAGDLISAFTARVGADRAAKWIAAKLGFQDCYCAERQQKLNELDKSIRKYLNRFGGKS